MWYQFNHHTSSIISIHQTAWSLRESAKHSEEVCYVLPQRNKCKVHIIIGEQYYLSCLQSYVIIISLQALSFSF